MLHFRSRIGEDVSSAEQLIFSGLTVSTSPSGCVHECNASSGKHYMQTRRQFCQCALDLIRYISLLHFKFVRWQDLIRWLASESQLVRKWRWWMR